MQDANANPNDNSQSIRESKSVPSDHLELDLEKIREFMYLY